MRTAQPTNHQPPTINHQLSTTNQHPVATIQTFRELRAWQQCRGLRQRVRLLVKTWPAEEKDKLIDQIIRASRAPTAMIAEGYGRFYEKENLRFCRMARGELYETQDHLITAFDDGYISEPVMNEHLELAQQAIKTVNGYMKYLKSFGADRSTGTASEPQVAYGDVFSPFEPVDLLPPVMEE